jgi:ABC-type uncharacterized transport system auxiliary subunit
VKRAPLAMPAAIAFVLLLGSASSCALTSKGDVVATRYFSPERVKPRLTGATLEPPDARAGRGGRSSRALVLGAITSGSDLRERIAFRNGAHEIGYYEDLRWTERPETYVRREIGRVLFEERGFERTAGGAPELDVEVLAFEEQRLPNGARAARVQLKVLLWDRQDVLFEETLTVERRVDAADPRIDDLVAAIATALDEAAAQVAARVAKALAARGAPVSRGED